MFYIFVDTASFEAESFGFETSAALVALENAVLDGHVTVLITDVTEREIRRRLSARISKAIASVKGHHELRVLRVVDFERWRALSIDDAVNDALAQWESYRTGLNPTVVSVDSVPASRVMDAFFEVRAPFSARKPNEFRDAFVLEALRTWAERENQQVIVASMDADLRDACDGTRLVHVQRVTDALARTLNNTALEQATRDRLAEQREVLLGMLYTEFPNLSVHIEDDYDADIEDTRVDDVQLDLSEFEMIEVRVGRVLMAGPATVQFTVDATVADYASGSRDEGDWVYLPYNEVTLADEVELRVVVRMILDEVPPTPQNIESVSIEAPKRIELSMGHAEVTIRSTRDNDSEGDDDGDDEEDDE